MSETTFYLRGIDLVELTQKYIQGQFIQVSSRLPVKSTSSLEPFRPAVSTTVKPIRNYEFSNESGRSFIYIGYRVHPNGKYGEVAPEVPGNCMYCLNKVDPNVTMGICIAKESGDHLKIAYGFDTAYHTIDLFCYYGCVYAELKERLKGGNPIYAYSMTYLKEIYERDTGQDFATLRPSPDYRLLKIFNGPMDYSEFHGDIKYSKKPEGIYYLTVIQSLEKDA